MANSLGGLIVTLGLDAAEFTRGLTKAEYQAKQFAQNTNAAILQVAKVIGGLELGRIFLDATKEIISSAAALNDLSDATGSSVESLSRLSNQAQIAGTDFATVQNALLKLSQGMAGADEESNKTKEALRILGITTKDPVQALQEVAVKLNTYADGVNKVGFAVAIFRKGGEQFTATLKDIANLQDVAATTTTKQAEEAEKLTQAYQRLVVESTKFKNAVLDDIVPALTAMINEMRTGTEVAGGFLNALFLFGGVDLSDPQKEIDKIIAKIAELRRQEAAAGGFGIFSDINLKGIRNNIEAELKRLEYVQKILAQRSGAGPLPGFKPEAPNPPSSAKAGRVAKEQISDAERYIQSLEKQLEATLELNAVDLAEVEIYNLQQKALSGLNAERIASIRDYAAQIKASKDAKDAAAEQKKAEEEAARIRERNSKETTRRIEDYQKEAKGIRDSNEQMQEEIVFLRGGEAGLRAYNEAKLAQLVLKAKDAEFAAIIGGADKAELDALHDITKAREEQVAVFKQLGLEKQLAAEAKAAQDFANIMTDSFSNAFEGFIDGTKNARDAFRDFAKDIERYLIKLALHKLGDAIFGGNTAGGPDFFTLLAKALSAYGAGAGAGASGIADIGAGGGGGLAYAANGTNYARGGLTIVGEHGKELVNLPRGAQVKPLSSIGKHGNVYHINQSINVMPGASTASVRQAKAQLRDATMSAVRDR